MTDSIIAAAPAQDDLPVSAAPAVISVNATRATGYGSVQQTEARDDLGALGAPDAQGMRPILEDPSVNTSNDANPTDGLPELPPLTAADAGTQIPAGPEAEAALNEALGLPPVEERPVGTLDPSEVAEPILADNGTDLTRLTKFNEERGKRALQQRTKKPREEGQAGAPKGEGKKQQPRQDQAPKAPQKPSLLRNEKSQNFLRDAMTNRREDKDGEQHINTSAMAATPLGRQLDVNARTPFVHPDLGRFQSVGGLWYYVGGETQDEAFRQVYGSAARAKGKRVKMRTIEGFKTILAEATWIKVLAHDDLVKQMVANELPYRCYFTVGEMNLPQSTQYADWYVAVLEEIGRTLKEIHLGGNAQAAPNFDFVERPARQDRRDFRGERRDQGNRGDRDNRPSRDRRAQR